MNFLNSNLTSVTLTPETRKSFAIHGEILDANFNTRDERRLLDTAGKMGEQFEIDLSYLATSEIKEIL